MLETDRLKHSLGVARKLKSMAEYIRSDDIGYAEDMFMLGFLHDIGYEFTDSTNHASVGGQFVKKQGFKYWMEVCSHGKVGIDYASDELEMLNIADLLVDSRGEDTNLHGRFRDIGERHGLNSKQYVDVSKLYKTLNFKKYGILNY